MTKKAKLILIFLILLSFVWVGFNLYGTRITGTVSHIVKTEQANEEAKPVIQFMPNASYAVCTDSSQLEAYDSLYLSLVTECTDEKGNDILDEKHIDHSSIDWTKKGEQVIHYTVTDDFGNQTEADCTVTLTDPIDTGH